MKKLDGLVYNVMSAETPDGDAERRAETGSRDGNLPPRRPGDGEKVRVKVGLKSVLAFFGKGETKVAAVFGISPEPCHAAVMHLKAGAPEVPIWLFATAAPLPETSVLCEQVFVSRRSLFLFLRAQIELWPYWVAIAVGTWTAEHGRWPLKLAPFFIPLLPRPATQ